jgi:quercetin dioxygenase-like cupin family protein
MNVHCEVSQGMDGIERYAAMFPEDRIVPCAPGASWSVKPGDGVTLVYWSFQAPECGELPMHGHHQTQSGYVIDGEMIMKFEDGTQRVLKTGDFYWIPSGTKHGAEVKDRVTIIDVYTPGRPDYEEIFRFSLRAKEAANPKAREAHAAAAI